MTDKLVSHTKSRLQGFSAAILNAIIIEGYGILLDQYDKKKKNKTAKMNLKNK